MQIYSTSPAPTVPATGLPSNITPDIKDPATRVSPKNTKVKKKRVVPCSSVASQEDLRGIHNALILKHNICWEKVNTPHKIKSRKYQKYCS